jgi:hypothetical protein
MTGLPPIPLVEVPSGPPARPPGLPLASSGGEPFSSPWTHVSLGASRSGLEVLFEMMDAPPLRVTKERSQEPVFEDECVELFWAGSGPPGRYAEIVVNPLGTLYTAWIENPDGDRRTWKVSPQPLPGIEARVAGFPGGPAAAWERWTCLIFAPWAALTPGEPPPGPGEIHRGNLFRIARGRETRFEALSPTGRTPPDFHVPARFGRFIFPNLL